MANKKILAGILALALIFGMALIGCNMDGGDSSGSKADTALNGTWRGTVDNMQIEMVMNNGSFTQSVVSPSTPMARGSYTTSGDQMVITISGIHGSFFSLMSGGSMELGNQYYTKSSMESAVKAAIREMLEEGMGLSGAALDAAVNEAFAEGAENYNEMFEPQTGTYSISGNTLTITIGDPMVLTKQ